MPTSNYRPSCDPKGAREICVVAGDRVPMVRPVSKSVDVFSLWSTISGGEGLPQTPSSWGSYSLASVLAPTGRLSALFMVEIWGHEIAREVDAGTVSPLGNTLAETDLTRPDQFTNHSSRLKVRLQAHNAGHGSSRIFDVAQGIRFAIEASTIRLWLLYPVPGSVITRNGSSDKLLGPGLVLDSEVGCYIATTEGPPGRQLGTNTITVRVPAGTAEYPVWIPEGTRAVTIYQTSTGDIFAPQWRIYRTTAVDDGPSLGQITLDNTTRRVVSLPRPGNAGMITMGSSDGANDRTATIVFELEI